MEDDEDFIEQGWKLEEQEDWFIRQKQKCSQVSGIFDFSVEEKDGNKYFKLTPNLENKWMNFTLRVDKKDLS